MAVDMNGKSKVKNLCDWQVSWSRINSIGDEVIKANSAIYISNQEIESQKENGNVFFNGNDGIGSHARVYIENIEMREQLGFDNKEEKRTQLILDDEKCKKLLEYKTLEAFKKNITESVITNQEKTKIMNYARKIKINELDKVRILEEITELQF